MGIILIVLAFTHLCAFLIGWGIKSDIRNGGGNYSPEDRIINEMRQQRAADYVNNPVVKEMQREMASRTKT